MGELARRPTVEPDRLRALARAELLVVLGAVLLVNEGGEHGFASEVFLLRRRAHRTIGLLLRQVGLVLRQRLVREDVQRCAGGRLGVCCCRTAMGGDVALEALAQGWQVYLGRQWI